MANNTISPVPNNQPVLNQAGLISQVWSSFLNDLWTRAGGPTAQTNAELGNAISSITAISSLTGDVVTDPVTGVQSATATIQDNVVTNAKLSQMPSNTIKGNNTIAEANALDLTPAQIVAMLPIPQQLEFHVGPLSNTASSLITSATFVNFSNSPTLSFIPTLSGKYKIYASLPLKITNAGDSAQALIKASAGGPALVAQSIGNLSGSAGIQSNQYIQSVFTLVAGTSYSFDVQGQCSSSAGCQIPAIGYYIFAERISA